MSTTETPMAASVARFVARLVIGLPSTISRSARKAPTATRYHPIRRFRRRAGSKGSVVAIASSLSQPLEAHPGGYVGPSASTGHLAVLVPLAGALRLTAQTIPPGYGAGQRALLEQPDEVRASDQSQDGQGARPDDPTGAAVAGRSGHPVAH